MKTDTTLRLTRSQYRKFAEQVKHAGCALSLSTFRAMGNCWGIFDPRAKLTCMDVSTDDLMFTECANIQLSTSVQTGLMRNESRPEIDWSALEDDEIYPFIVAHEVGHRMDNFCYWDTSRIDDEQIRTRCESTIRSINEVLADRYAWSQIRPGEPVPLCEYGKSIQDEVAFDLALMDKYIPRVHREARKLPSGRYLHIPEAMLLTDSLISYVGTGVSAAAVISVREKARTYRRDTRSRAR
ncbi:hypothetical protein RHM65_04540 [Pseudomonas sp. CCI4.2]|uniref:hypothetical protein n=1 Tax=Pseudomonas sp. CCI4.2 TaxID=3048620 RepID=UPI002AC96B40|nr:hypothetical protein [Pseudomonas sp. CCI4.2]MEB0091797.1 hypothetical protein [Pseudomonas sp. CCI4.2]WPX54852.1 hypothetical protein RHM65_04540 [Pseudomonas sp. CCI4.2]